MTDIDIDEFLGQPPRTRWRRWRKWVFIGVPLLIVLLLLARCLRPAPPGPLRDRARRAARPQRDDHRDRQSGADGAGQCRLGGIGTGRQGLCPEQRPGGERPAARPARPVAAARRAGPEPGDACRRRSRRSTQNRATVAQTRANLAREQQVYKLSGGKVPSRTELDTARADYARAVANVAQARGASRAGAGRRLDQPDQPRQGHDLCAGHRRGAVAPGRARADGGRIVQRRDPVHDRPGPFEHAAAGEGRRSRCRRAAPRRARHLHGRRLSQPDLPGDGDAGRSRRQCDADREQRRDHADDDRPTSSPTRPSSRSRTPTGC